MSAAPGPEVILCDSSLVGIQERALTRSDATAHWPPTIVERLDSAVLAISVFSLAEIRAGRIYANWGQRRSDAQEARLAAFVKIPLDEDILAEYAPSTPGTSAAIRRPITICGSQRQRSRAASHWRRATTISPVLH
jgi:hypothetical protein